jgi:hypothetical protein
MQVAIYSPDVTQPVLRLATLNMTSKIVTLNFQKIVKKASISFSSFVLQSKQVTTTATEYITLSSSLAMVTSTGFDSNTVKFALSDDTFNTMKLFSSLGHAISSSYLAFTSSFISDKANPANEVVAISTASAFKFTDYAPDRQRPTLVSFYMDMGYNRMCLTFSEPMDQSTILVSDIKLLSDSNDIATTVAVSLSSAFIYKASGASLYFQLTTTEANAVKSAYPLCTNPTQCYISHTSALGFDVTTYTTKGVAVQNPIYPTTALLTSSSFVYDTVPPMLAAFSIDMTHNMMLLVCECCSLFLSVSF